MREQPPADVTVQRHVARIHSAVRAQIGRRRRRSLHMGIGAAVVAVLGITGTTVATAVNSPTHIDVSTAVKTVYAEDVAACLRADGWDASVRNIDEPPSTLGSTFDSAVYSAVWISVAEASQRRWADAIDACMAGKWN